MDAECFKRKFLPFHAKLFRIACVLVESKEDAEDILQDVYSKLWTKRDELQSIKSPEAYCITLVKNACLDFMRSARHPRHTVDASQASALPGGTTPAQEIEMQDQIRQVQKLISRLPENQKRVLRLRSIEDCTMDDIGQITGLTAANIRVLLTRARKTLREQIAALYGKGQE